MIIKPLVQQKIRLIGIVLLLKTQLINAQTPSQTLSILKESSPVITAVIDTGVDINHPDLKDHIWTNPGESGIDSLNRDKSRNNIDDDNNGYIDDVHGWNFVDNNNNVLDTHGHGTHVAGIINKSKLSSTRLMILKYYSATAKEEENLVNSLLALKYAIDHNSHIINYSGGGESKNKLEEELIKEALNKNIILVAAAGNNSKDNDKLGFYPASYKLPNIIAVAAMDNSLRLLPSSNYGKNTVHLIATGKNIYSSLPHAKYGFMTGTSQATAIVTEKLLREIQLDKKFRISLVKNQLTRLKLSTTRIKLYDSLSSIANK